MVKNMINHSVMHMCTCTSYLNTISCNSLSAILNSKPEKMHKKCAYSSYVLHNPYK